MGYNSCMAQLRCQCGCPINVPDSAARRPVVCPSCRTIANARAHVPYGYAPYSSWHINSPNPRLTQGQAPVVTSGVQYNTPARISFICGIIAAYLACANRAGYQTKAVVALSLLALATAIIGLHISGMPSAGRRGRVPAFFGLGLAVLALLATPLPISSNSCPPRRMTRVVTATPEKAPAIKTVQGAPPAAQPPAPPQKPANPVDDEQEEGF